MPDLDYAKMARAMAAAAAGDRAYARPEGRTFEPQLPRFNLTADDVYGTPRFGGGVSIGTPYGDISVRGSQMQPSGMPAPMRSLMLDYTRQFPAQRFFDADVLSGGLPIFDQLEKNVRINPQSWDRMVASWPQSKNIEDRRNEMDLGALLNRPTNWLTEQLLR